MELRTKCKCCGEEIDFIYHYDKSTYAYKLSHNASYYYFCSYKCMREYEKTHEVKKYKTINRYG